MTKMHKPVEQIIIELSNWIAECGLTQQEIALKAGVNQATVNRALNRKGRQRVSKPLIQLCKYADIDVFIDEDIDPSKNKDLMDAVRFAWNGSTIHAKKLAKVIKELGRLSGQN